MSELHNIQPNKVFRYICRVCGRSVLDPRLNANGMACICPREAKMHLDWSFEAGDNCPFHSAPNTL